MIASLACMPPVCQVRHGLQTRHPCLVAMDTARRCRYSCSNVLIAWRDFQSPTIDLRFQQLRRLSAFSTSLLLAGVRLYCMNHQGRRWGKSC